MKITEQQIDRVANLREQPLKITNEDKKVCDCLRKSNKWQTREQLAQMAAKSNPAKSEYRCSFENPKPQSTSKVSCENPNTSPDRGSRTRDQREKAPSTRLMLNSWGR